MGLDPVTLGAAFLLGEVVNTLIPEEELDIPAVRPLDLESEGVDIQIGVDEFEGLSTEEARAKRRLRTDTLEFNNNNTLFSDPQNDPLRIGGTDAL